MGKSNKRREASKRVAPPARELSLTEAIRRVARAAVVFQEQALKGWTAKTKPGPEPGQYTHSFTPRGQNLTPGIALQRPHYFNSPDPAAAWLKERLALKLENQPPFSLNPRESINLFGITPEQKESTAPAPVHKLGISPIAPPQYWAGLGWVYDEVGPVMTPEKWLEINNLMPFQNTPSVFKASFNLTAEEALKFDSYLRGEVDSVEVVTTEGLELEVVREEKIEQPAHEKTQDPEADPGDTAGDQE